jgi:hypothetical protein
MGPEAGRYHAPAPKRREYSIIMLVMLVHFVVFFTLLLLKLADDSMPVYIVFIPLFIMNVSACLLTGYAVQHYLLADLYRLLLVVSMITLNPCMLASEIMFLVFLMGEKDTLNWSVIFIPLILALFIPLLLSLLLPLLDVVLGYPRLREICTIFKLVCFSQPPFLDFNKRQVIRLRREPPRPTKTNPSPFYEHIGNGQAVDMRRVREDMARMTTVTIGRAPRPTAPAAFIPTKPKIVGQPQLVITGNTTVTAVPGEISLSSTDLKDMKTNIV